MNNRGVNIAGGRRNRVYNVEVNMNDEPDDALLELDYND